ncbi:hypothetical protein [Pseudogulbenkiania sp. MAI-1]|nr:hypothetical protein [Pseudogulbenkiania sp. MAI-1]
MDVHVAQHRQQQALGVVAWQLGRKANALRFDADDAAVADSSV